MFEHIFEHIIYKESKLKNWLTILTAQNTSIPVVDVEVWTRTGYRYEKPDELGYAHLLEHMLFGGTKRRPTALELSIEVESRGGYCNAGTSQESVVYEMQMMSKDAEQMCDILSDMILESTLSSDRLNIERNVVLQELKQKQEDHSDYSSRIAPKRIISGHPMAQNILDTEQTTKDATSEKLRSYLEQHYRPDQSALVMAGDISHDKAVSLAEKYFSKWVNPSVPFDPGLVPMPRASKNYYFEKRDIKQSFLTLAYYATPVKDLHESAIWRMVSGYLSIGHASAFTQELREKLGLVYNIGSSKWASNDMGLYMIGTSTQKPRETIDAIDRVVANISSQLTLNVFERVKGQAIGGFVRKIVKPGNQSSVLGEDFISYSRIIPPQEWLDQLQSVTRNEVLDLAQKYLHPQNSVLVVLGPDDIGR